MPKWLQMQIQKAFNSKNTSQILLLNQCWFFYQKNNQKDAKE
ncbi:MAG: cortex morphogenetic protein CmpA [Bacillus sp. (in: firmicutes)]